MPAPLCPACDSEARLTTRRASRRWRDELAPGRVFQLKRKTYGGAPVCVLITNVPGPWSVYPMCVEVDATGCVHSYSTDKARKYVGGLRPHQFTGSLVAGRRCDLERFDAFDIALIRYGVPLSFGGKLSRHSLTKEALPLVPCIVWTIFWTKYENWVSCYDAASGLYPLLNGAWHLRSRAGGDWTFGRSSCLTAWATAHRDPARLRAIERWLRQRHDHLEICSVRAVQVINEYGERCLRAEGNHGPAIWYVSDIGILRGTAS